MVRFTIRDLLWLMVVVALGLTWWLDARRRDAANARLRGELAIEIRQLFVTEKVLDIERRNAEANLGKRF